MDKLEGCFDKLLGSCILGLMFFIIIFLVAASIIAAYAEILYTNITIRDILSDLETFINSSKVKSIDLNKLNDFRSQLIISTQRGLDISSIRFLYQLLSAAVISAGVYLLSRSYRNFKKSEIKANNAAKKAEKIGSFIQNMPAYSVILTNIIVVNQNLWIMLSIKDDSQRKEFLPTTRDSITFIYNNLKKAAIEGKGFDRNQVQQMVDNISKIIDNLTQLQNQHNLDMSDLISKCGLSCDLLQNANFIDIYDKQLESLIN